MITNGHKERPVLLIGSVPLGSAREVFEAVSSSLGSFVRRIPDGETGPRLSWISCQQPVMESVKVLEAGGELVLMGGAVRQPLYKLRDGGTPCDVKFGALGYAESALASYREFERLQKKGEVGREVRFQVSLPTPLAVVSAFFVPAAVRTIWPIYERRLLEELDTITSTIPHHALAIQWDIAVEIHSILENPSVGDQYSKSELVDAIARASDCVPRDVELGFHLCYGDPGHKHIVEPRDTGLMVDLANSLSKAIAHPIAWIHMPVPRNRDDDDYFASLRSLKLRPETELYLGLVHLTDGIEGAKRRLAAAMRAIPDFGIATECGFGRRQPETIPELLALHREVALLGQTTSDTE